MKIAPFSYVKPTSLSALVEELELAEANGGGKILAGGQSLLPVLAMRLGRPRTLIDITGIPELSKIEEVNNNLVIGAAVRQRHVEKFRRLGVPLLQMALPWIGHREIRSRGTVCGSLAHADPSAELPAVASCLNAKLDVLGPKGTRTLSARDAFVGAMTTSLQSDEVITSARFPLATDNEGFGFAEFARRHGDFALAGVATRVLVENQRISHAALVAFGVSDRPQFANITEELNGLDLEEDAQTISAESLMAVMEDISRQLVTTGGDYQASQAYRQHLVKVLGARELNRALSKALRRK